MNLRFNLLATLFIIILSQGLFAQERVRRGGPPGGQRSREPIGTVTGMVADEASGNPLEYANISIFSMRDSTLITGTTSDDKGYFEMADLMPGRYFVEAKFIGYQSQMIDTVRIFPRRPVADLGTINLNPGVLGTQTVEIVQERPLVSYHLDKKVIDVSQQFSATSGSAVDVLENVPSIAVDIDGNVELRGSSNFTVLIDGRPTILDANDALAQTPANIISTIELITNPSAKYDPDGVAGIINIVTKKRLISGISGLVNTHGGTYDNFGGDGLLSFRNSSLNGSIGAYYNLRSFPGTIKSTNTTTFDGTSTSIESDGTRNFQMNRINLVGEIALDITKNDMASVAFRIGDLSFDRGSESTLFETINSGSPLDPYSSESNTDRGGTFMSLNSEYRHKFATPLHELTARLNFGGRDAKEVNISEDFDTGDAKTQGLKVTEEGPARRIRSKIEYTRPISETAKFEAGYQGRMGSSEDETQYFQYDLGSATYLKQAQFGHNISYDRNIHALYSQYSNEGPKVGYQFGVRGEYTDRRIVSPEADVEFVIDRWDIFPTVHTSYKVNERIQLTGSYSLRINRPRGWFLEPFVTWVDAANVRSGNAELLPEYVNSYELGTQLPLGKNTISIEAYYRQTENATDRVRSVYDTNVMLTRPQNIGDSESLGTELMLNFRQLQWWNVTLIGTIYKFSLAGEFDGREYSSSSDNWSMRLNNTFRLSENSRIQVNSRFNSPTVSAQGRREGMYSTSVSVRHTMLDKRLSATLQLGDIFRTQQQETTSAGPNFDYYSLMTRKPMTQLTLTYNFNKYKQKRSERGEGESLDDDF